MTDNSVKTVLGIDCSSSTVGWAVLSMQTPPVLIAYGHIKPEKKKATNNIVERLDLLSKEIDKLCKTYNPDKVVIEEIIQFIRRKSSANTIITLAVFNRACALQTYRSTGYLPIFISPITIRARIAKSIGVKKLTKEDILQKVMSFFGAAFKWAPKRMGKNKGQPVVETGDEADAIAAAWSYIIYILAPKGKVKKK